MAESKGYAGAESKGYAGDIDCAEAWEKLKNDPGAVLVDCRTEAEWKFVGLPSLEKLGKEVARVCWQGFPEMRQNPKFAEEIHRLAPDKKQPLLFICRSGARSQLAAMAMTAQGHERCYNVAHGFEGDADEVNHRGGKNGWKAAGLPWAQE